MPGSVAAAVPSTVMPYSLCSAWKETRTRPCRISGPYPDGRSQRAVLATVSRYEWELSKQLTYAEWTALQQFFVDRGGSLEPFYFYPEKIAWDATGNSVFGRWTVRFNGSLSRTFQMSRQQASLSLIEVA